MSIEVLAPERARVAEIAAEYGLADELPAIQAAIAAEVPSVIQTGRQKAVIDIKTHSYVGSPYEVTQKTGRVQPTEITLA